MRENRELDELALVVVVLRALSGMTQTELAEAAGTTASVISEYETGKRRPSRKTVERFAEVLDIPSQKIDGLLPFLRALRDSSRRISPSLSQEELALRTARDVESLVIEALGMALMDRLDRPPSSESEERVKARSVWERLEVLGRTHRRLLVEEGVEFQTWALCEILCEESFEMAEHDREEALDLAELAVQVAGKVAGEPAWRSRIQGYAWAHLGHARGFGETGREPTRRCSDIGRSGVRESPLPANCPTSPSAGSRSAQPPTCGKAPNRCEALRVCEKDVRGEGSVCARSGTVSRQSRAVRSRAALQRSKRANRLTERPFMCSIFVSHLQRNLELPSLQGPG